MTNDPAANFALTPPLADLPAHAPVRNAQSPAAVYLASLSKGSRRTMRTALNIIGELLGVGEVLNADGQDVRCLVGRHMSGMRLSACLAIELDETSMPAAIDHMRV